MKPAFITFEGIDGCGKTTVMASVAKRLAKAGCKVAVTREPTETWLGDAVRRSYKERVSPYTEAYLFLADRATHTDWIRKQLSNGRSVVSDRYSDSTVAYQAAFLHQRLGGEPPGYMDWLERISEPAILEPDITFLLDVDPRVSLKRLKGRPEKEKFETLRNLRQVRSNYLAIAQGNPRVLVIDASGSLQEVESAVVSALSKFLGVKL
jgi:dTMP kinase